MKRKLQRDREIVCPFCHKLILNIWDNLGVHIREVHGETKFREAILKAKAQGMSDPEIGLHFGISFRQLEQIITEVYGTNISILERTKKIKSWTPKDFHEEITTVWSFKQRGNWATHSGEYRGNWSPYIPRNIILKYSRPGELVLDYFCGAGTTAVEAKLLGRKCIAFDINDAAVELAKNNVTFNIEPQQKGLFINGSNLKIYEPELTVGDARDLSFLGNNSIDLICAHPPYANIIHYTDHKNGDLSFLDINEFLKEMSKVAKESFRVLKPGRQCAILIGDARREKHVIPLGFKLINVYLNAGFKLKEFVIKRQHNCKTTGFWYEKSIKYNFLLLAHEYLPIFEKPKRFIPPTVREKALGYDKIISNIRRPTIKKRLDRLETTTVWILPDKDLEKFLNKNIIKRYSNGRNHLTITLDSSYYENKKSFDIKKKDRNYKLLFIKSPFLDNYPSQTSVESYLKKVKKTITQRLNRVSKGGFLVIQTKDIRISKYIEPLAERIVDILTSNSLWLKEIVVITQKEHEVETSKENLGINHQYLLIYEKVKRI